MPRDVPRTVGGVAKGGRKGKGKATKKRHFQGRRKGKKHVAKRRVGDERVLDSKDDAAKRVLDSKDDVAETRVEETFVLGSVLGSVFSADCGCVEGQNMYGRCSVCHVWPTVLDLLQRFDVNGTLFSLRVEDFASESLVGCGGAAEYRQGTNYVMSLLPSMRTWDAFLRLLYLLRASQIYVDLGMKPIEFRDTPEGFFSPIRKYAISKGRTYWCLDIRYCGPGPDAPSHGRCLGGELIVGLYCMDVRDMLTHYSSRCMLSEYYRLADMIRAGKN